MEWLDGGRIAVDPPERPKKITGTRFGAVLGLNKWSSPFKAWCEITRTYEEPFRDTKYTLAGKAIEPKQAEYMKKAYYMPGLVKPSDVWGDDYFKVTRGDFFPSDPVFGGMWDYILKDADGNVTAVLEMKTSKRSEDWEKDVPEYYALQAALYARLLGVEQVYMVASFLAEDDYGDPAAFVPSAENTLVVPFKVHERYPLFEFEYMNRARRFWKDHVESGVSPEYDENRDADILSSLRAVAGEITDDIKALIDEAEALTDEIGEAKAKIENKEKRYKQITDMIRKKAAQSLTDGAKRVDLAGRSHVFSVSAVESSRINTERLKADGLYERYLDTCESLRLTVSKRKE